LLEIEDRETDRVLTEAALLRVEEDAQLKKHAERELRQASGAIEELQQYNQDQARSLHNEMTHRTKSAGYKTLRNALRRLAKGALAGVVRHFNPHSRHFDAHSHHVNADSRHFNADSRHCNADSPTCQVCSMDGG